MIGVDDEVQVGTGAVQKGAAGRPRAVERNVAARRIEPRCAVRTEIQLHAGSAYEYQRAVVALESGEGARGVDCCQTQAPIKRLRLRWFAQDFPRNSAAVLPRYCEVARFAQDDH